MSTTYCYSLDGETFTDRLETRALALKEAQTIQPDYPVSTGECIDITAASLAPSAKDLIEQMTDRLCDEVGEAAEYFDPSRTQTRELGEGLSILIGRVFGTEPLECFGVRNIEEHSPEEASS